MAEKTNYNPQQRAQMFAVSTRQNLQMMAKQTVTHEASTIQFNLPKARLLSGTMLRFKGRIRLTSAGETRRIYPDMFTNYRLIRRISLDLNNGFAPFVLSGTEALMYNMVSAHPDIYKLQTPASDTDFNYIPGEVVATNDGSDVLFAFTIMLENALNGRDPISYVLLQNDQTNVTISIDVGTVEEMLPDELTVDKKLLSLEVSAMTETFSIPNNANAFPDLSVLKIVNGRKDSLPTSGQQVIKLTTGMIYRKIIFRMLDENGEPVDDTDILSDIMLTFNQADTNYAIHPTMLRLKNTRDLGYALPRGMFVFDFSASGGVTNMGGSRDYIDSANLQELWLKFNTNFKGKVEIVTECLSRLA